jgi:hypothetical protein
MKWLLLCGAACWAVTATPPVQTLVQQQITAESAVAAKIASEAAKPELLKAFGAAEVRNLLQPALAVLTPTELWTRSVHAFARSDVYTPVAG